MSTAANNSLRGLLWEACLIATVMSLFGVTVALAASGALDTTFHGTGKYRLDIVAGQSGDAGPVAIQSDGKIVVAGSTAPSSTNSNIALVRFTTKGALDTTFNGTGKRVADLGGYDQGRALVIDPATGKIIVAGVKCLPDGSNCNAALVRFNPNGKPDLTFNGTGKRVDDFGGDDNGWTGAVALQPDGKIVAGGYMYNSTTGNYDFAVARYTPSGALDKTFAGTGKKSIGFGAGRQDFADELAIQPDGKIVVAGDTCDSGYANCNFAVVRLNANATLDATFSGDGRQTTDFGSHDVAWGMALQADGKVVVVGNTGAFGYNRYALARYKTNGALDATFAGTGKKVIDLSGSGQSGARVVRIQPSNGKIVVCGQSAGNMVVARFNVNGTLDKTFHTTGKSVVDFKGDDACWGLAIQADGKYVLAGYTVDSYTVSHWAVARMLP